MSAPVDLTFRNMDATPELDAEIRARAAWLETYHPGIERCRVVLEVPHRHQRRGREIWVAIDVGLPDGPVRVHHRHEPSAEPPEATGLHGARGARHNREAQEAIREAFHVVRRRVADVVRRRRAG